MKKNINNIVRHSWRFIVSFMVIFGHNNSIEERLYCIGNGKRYYFSSVT